MTLEVLTMKLPVVHIRNCGAKLVYVRDATSGDAEVVLLEAAVF